MGKSNEFFKKAGEKARIEAEKVVFTCLMSGCIAGRREQLVLVLPGSGRGMVLERGGLDT